MSYPSLKETLYHAAGPEQVILVVPHGADATEFLEFFPEIPAHPDLEKIWPLFRSYLAIERDAGASELAHALGARLASTAGYSVQVLEMNYPRGIVDGGRLNEHCLRPCLPHTLFDELKAAFLALHQTSLAAIDRVYEKMAEHPACFLLDVHTMASYCPVNAEGERRTEPVAFATLASYVNQYLEAREHRYQRQIDLICSAADGRKLADPLLLQALTETLSEDGYTCLENEPYHAAPIYLSYQHMQKVPSLSIDVPKHLVASNALEPYELDQIRVDPLRIDRLAASLARGLERAFSRKYQPEKR